VNDVSRIEEQIARLWRRRSARGAQAARACKHNLVVVTERGAAALERDTRLVASVSRTEPGRALVVSPAGDAAEPLRAWVPEGQGALDAGEQITLAVREDAWDLVPATVLQLLVGDMPVYTLWRRPALEPRPTLDSLCSASERLIVDASALRAPLADLVELAGTPGLRLDDLCWWRLEPWREAVAALFDPAPLRPALEHLQRVAIAAGDRTSAAYLAGWLASRLGWRPDADGFSRPDGGRVEIELAIDERLPAGQAGSVALDAAGESPARFVVERVAEALDVVHLRVERQGAAPQTRCLKLPTRDDGAVLAGMLQRREVDPVHRDAARCATRLGRRG
jgi:glucose-6-phosphate dehydrogenase assembly protein OpcA